MYGTLPPIPSLYESPLESIFYWLLGFVVIMAPFYIILSCCIHYAVKSGTREICELLDTVIEEQKKARKANSQTGGQSLEDLGKYINGH
jgi:hypothetical protein